ncbi:MAG: Rieske 2Fe-2S domain-containing protein [Anaerolineae bacterium]|nr:Rieske 2Fe-2S domain-containing protein [Anaerolineae bacterium]
MTKLSDLIVSLEIQPAPTGLWSVLGVEVEIFEQYLRTASRNRVELQPYHSDNLAALDGLLLAEALSTHNNSLLLLQQIAEQLHSASTLLVVDWQADGPPNYGPNFDNRFKKGWLCRLLREWGFGYIETLEHHPVYYVIRGVKGPAPSLTYANEFIEVARLDELPGNSMQTVDVFGHMVVIANTGQEIVAFDQTCPHANGKLDKGLLRRRNIACPLHGYIWNIITGEPLFPDDEDCLRRYRVKINEEQQTIMISLAPPQGFDN